MKAHFFIKVLVLLVIAILSFCKNPMEQSRKATLIISISSLQAKLMPSSGDPINLSFVINNGNTAICINNTIPTGYYTLDLQLFEAGTLAIGAVEVVRIMKDQLTAGTFKFYDLILKRNIQVNIIPEVKEAIDIILHGQLNEISAGTPMNIAASVAGEENDMVFV